MGGLKDNMARLNEEIASGHACRVEMLQNLKKDVAELKNDVGEMLTDFGKKRSETRQQMQSELQDFTSHLRHFADDLGEQVVNMRKGFHRERTDMIDKMNENLGGFMAALKNGVTQMKEEFKTQRIEAGKRIKGDLNAFCGQLKAFSHHMETTVDTLLSQWRSDRQKGCNVCEAENSVVQDAEISKRTASDDLTQIRGIGAKRQQLLNMAGINSYAQLAQSTPEQIMQILGAQGGSAQVDLWISDAQAMINDLR